MTVLEAHGVGVAWAASVSVLKDVSFVLVPGFYDLVGANGAGKTTLLRVLAGELPPHEGSVRVRAGSGGSGVTIAYCAQAVDEPGGDVHALAGAHDGIASEIKGRLRLEPDEIARWPTLSPGERKRWQIGAALAREPDVLLLDEPTNHLDGEARDRLLGALARFRGIGVVVSHDRVLLDRLPRAILRVHDGSVTMYPGRYAEARAIWEEARRSREEAHARAKAKVRAIERRLDAARRTQEAASRATSSRSRMKDANDRDGRSMGRKVVARWAEARAGRAVEVVRGELSRARAEVPVIERDRTLGGAIFATWERAPQPGLFHVDAPEIRAGDRPVLRNVRLTIGREDRVRIAGPNGAGKTTLLHALRASRRRNDPEDGRVLYLPQELDPARVAALGASLRSLGEEERGRVLSVFAALGSDPAVRRTPAPSRPARRASSPSRSASARPRRADEPPRPAHDRAPRARARAVPRLRRPRHARRRVRREGDGADGDNPRRAPDLSADDALRLFGVALDGEVRTLSIVTRAAALAISLVCLMAPLTASGSAQAEELVITTAPRASAQERRYHPAPILGLDPVKEAAKLRHSVRRDVLRADPPKEVVSSEEKAIIIVAAAIVGVVIVVAVLGGT